VKRSRTDKRLASRSKGGGTVAGRRAFTAFGIQTPIGARRIGWGLSGSSFHLSLLPFTHNGWALLARSPPSETCREERARGDFRAVHRAVCVRRNPTILIPSMANLLSMRKDRRLAQQTKILKERNASLLRAVSSVKPNPNASTILVSSTGEECVSRITCLGRVGWSFSSGNPVQTAYIASLESQISSLRDELATVYKTQSQNSQRLLSMNETLREKEEAIRIESEALRRANDELSILRRKVDQHNEVMQEKDRTVQVRQQSALLDSLLSTAVPDSTRWNQHSSTRARTDRRPQPDPVKRQREAPTALAWRQTGRSQQTQWGQRILWGDAVSPDGRVGKRGSPPHQPPSEIEGGGGLSEGKDDGSDAEWLIVEDDDNDIWPFSYFHRLSGPRIYPVLIIYPHR